jgi:hypothetical protein
MPPSFFPNELLVPSLKNTILEPPNSQDLLPQPTKALDLWRIEGGGLDLHPHRSDLLFPLICLRGLVSWVSLCPKILICVFDILLLVVWQHCVVLGSLQFGCGCVPQDCKGWFRLKESLSGKWARPLWRNLAPENRVSLCGNNTPPT